MQVELNGIVFDTLNNGQLIEESHWKNGTLNGVKKTWYASSKSLSNFCNWTVV